MPIGKRPRPKVAKGKGSESMARPSRGYNGTSENKSPTGSRPRPNVARNTPSPKSPPPGGRKGVTPTPMPTPNRNATRR